MERKILLLIEDNPLLTGLYKAAFEKRGLNVFFAHNGEDGLKLAKDKKPDLLLLDVLMPGMDGFEVLKALKNDPLTKKIKVIILTIVNDKKSEQRAKEMGALDYLLKPKLKLKEIVEKVLAHI